LLALAGTLVLSTESILLRSLEQTTDPPNPATIIGIYGALVSLTALTTRRLVGSAPGTHPAGTTRAVVSAGVLQGASTVLFVLAVASSSVSDVVAMLAAAPLCIAAVAWAVLRERPERRVWWGIALSGAGVAAIATGAAGAGRVGGVAAAGGAVLAYAGSVTVLRRRPEADRLLVVAVAGTTMFLAALPWTRPAATSTLAWVLLVALGVVIGPSSRWMLAAASRYLPAASLGLFLPVETVAASVWAFLAFSEVPTTTTWVGGATVLLGLLVAMAPIGRTRSARAQSAL
jgi:drug/metabolite transporter (DMT)-like permease